MEAAQRNFAKISKMGASYFLLHHLGCGPPYVNQGASTISNVTL
jgi:hypothetical protein